MIEADGDVAKPALHFAHANGFPAACYALLLAGLERRFSVTFAAVLGHDPRYPISDGWPHLAEEFAETVRQQHSRPVIALGHSLGGYLSLLAAARWPELFRAVVLLDAPLPSRFQGSAMQFVKRVGLIDRVMPAGRTRDRRRHFASRSEAALHFRARALFRDFLPQALEDYVHHGLRPSTHGFSLAFDPDVETQIYRTFPHRLAQVAREVRCPIALIAGANSNVIDRIGLGASRRRMPVTQVPGGHLFPFEHPHAAGRAIEAACERLGVLA